MIIKNTVRRLAPLAVLPLLYVRPAQAQLLPQPSVPTTAAPLSFEEIFAGVNPAPLTLKTSDLKGEWRLVTIRTRPELEGNTSAVTLGHHHGHGSAQLREALGAAPGQFITQGQTVNAGGELFLVAYRMKFDESDLDKALEKQFASRQPNNAVMPPDEMMAFLENYARERPLELALINVKTLGELSGVRAFNADVQSASIRTFIQTAVAEDAARGTEKSPPTASAPKPPTTPKPATTTPKPPTATPATTSKPPAPAANAAANNATSQNNLKELGKVLSRYFQDHDGVLPPMGTPAQAKSALSPYAKNASIWQRADTGEAYRPNPMLSGRKFAHISNPDEFVAFYEVNPAPDGTRGVLFLDGSTKRITASEWPRYKKASKLR